MITFSARYRVFVHNPPDESEAGGSLKVVSMGAYRGGVSEWRSNDYETAKRKADRALSNDCRVGGWASVQEMNGHEKLATVYVTEHKR